jgi:hypothetical protein
MKKQLFTLVLAAAGTLAVAQVPRMALYEEFTGENCPPCAATNPGLDAMLALPTNASKVIPIKWQVPIPSAPSNTWSLYRTNESEIRWRYLGSGYGYGISSAPSGKMDGQDVTVFGAASNHPANLNATHISNAQAVTTPFGITLTPVYNPAMTSATVGVVINAASAVTTTNSIFRLCLIERHIEFPTAPGTNGEKEFQNVVIRSYPTTTSGTVTTGMGTAIPNTWTAGQTHTLSIVCAIPTYVRDLAELAFVGFIQDDANKKVWQAARSAQPSIPNDIKFNSLTINAVSCTTGITPTLNVANNGTTAITALTITPFINGVAQPVYTVATSIAGSATAAIALPTYTAGSGSNTFSVNISGVSGGDINLANNKGSQIFALVQNYVAGPITQTFAPTGTLPANWFISNPNGGPSYFTVNNSVGLSGAGSVKYDFYNNSATNTSEDLYLPPVNLSAMANNSITFDVAYTNYSGENDRLEVKVSTNCGSTWTTIYNKSGSTLQTAPTTTANFTPNASQWRNEVAALPAPANNNSTVLIKFTVTNQYGNNLYIDNVNVNNLTTVGIKNEAIAANKVELFPNPANASTNLFVNSNSNVKATVSIMNLLGQVVSQKQVNLTEGDNNITINTSELASGVYNVVLQGEQTVTKKLTVSK